MSDVELGGTKRLGVDPRGISTGSVFYLCFTASARRTSSSLASKGRNPIAITQVVRGAGVRVAVFGSNVGAQRGAHFVQFQVIPM